MCPEINVFGLQLPLFGMMMALGMLAGFALLFAVRKRSPFTEDDLLSAALWAIILGLLGAKILYWITELKSIIATPSVFKTMLTQGFVFYGALIGGVLGVWIYTRRSKKPFFAICDLFIPSLVLGQAFGRIGCFLAGCCYGMESSGGLCVTFPHGAGAGVPRIPVQLYESAFLFLLTAFLVWLLLKKKRQGTVIGWYGICYGVWRFIIEFFRDDDRGAVGALSTSQFIGLFVIVAGAAMLLLIKKGVIQDADVSRETSGDEKAEPVEEAAKAAGSEATGDSEQTVAGESSGDSKVTVEPENPSEEANVQEAQPEGETDGSNVESVETEKKP